MGICNSEKCSLRYKVKSPCISMSGSKTPDIMFIGDSPGEEEDIQNSNFVGKGGKILRDAIESCGIKQLNLSYANSVKCMTTEGKKSRPPTPKEISSCREHILLEILISKPKVIVLLGASALKSVLNKIGLTKIRGQIFYYSDIPVIPTYHPMSIYGDPSLLDDFLKDILFAKKALDVSSGKLLIYKTPVNYTLLNTKDKLIKFVNYASEFNEFVFDTETSGLNPFEDNSHIVCVSFCFKETVAFVLPFSHSYPIFNTSEEINLSLDVLKTLMDSNMGKIAHNGKFDMMWLEKIYGIKVKNFKFDTMLAQYLLSEEKSTHSLDYCSWRYTDMEDYYAVMHSYVKQHKEADPERGGSYANVPWDILVPYAAGDADCTYRVYNILKEKLNEN